MIKTTKLEFNGIEMNLTKPRRNSNSHSTIPFNSTNTSEFRDLNEFKRIEITRKFFEDHILSKSESVKFSLIYQ